MAGVAQEVRAEILLKIKSGEKVADLAKKYGISDRAIYNWLKGKLEQEVSYREYKRVLKENEQLKNILGVLTLEVEKSKKRSEITKDVIAKHPGTSKKLLSQVFTLSRQALYPRDFALPAKDEQLKEQILSVLLRVPELWVSASGTSTRHRQEES